MLGGAVPGFRGLAAPLPAWLAASVKLVAAPQQRLSRARLLFGVLVVLRTGYFLLGCNGDGGVHHDFSKGCLLESWD